MEETERPSALAEFRRRKDAFFRDDPGSPLTADQRATFSGLAYFAANPDLLVTAELEPADDPAPVVMETTGGGPRTYRVAGRVRFAVDGESVELKLYTAEGDRNLFLPFRDATSGTETYAAGRYLDLEPPRGGRVVIDFNQAYNPYCAYNSRWSCPLPPPDNWLRVAIRAGEQNLLEGHG